MVTDSIWRLSWTREALQCTSIRSQCGRRGPPWLSRVSAAAGDSTVVQGGVNVEELTDRLTPAGWRFAHVPPPTSTPPPYWRLTFRIFGGFSRFFLKGVGGSGRLYDRASLAFFKCRNFGVFVSYFRFFGAFFPPASLAYECYRRFFIARESTITILLRFMYF